MHKHIWRVFHKIFNLGVHKRKDWRLENLVWTGISGFIYNVYISGSKYDNKPIGYSKNLQKSAHVVAILSSMISENIAHRLFLLAGSPQLV